MMKEFTILPILGRRTDVPANDPSLFKDFGGVIATHDVGGLNFDLQRKRHVCTKANGYIKWSNTVNAQATKCLGLFELYDGTNRDHIIFDNGKVYVYDNSRNPSNKDAATPVTFATDNVDLYSLIKVGGYIVFADRAEHTPYKWKNGDANLTKLAQSGTEYKFRYLVNFSRRVIGLYCTNDSDAPDLSVRWSTAWPATAITSLNFPAANQLYIPNDDSIVGGATMGTDKCFIYCENSIQQLVYYPDYETPFRCFTVVPNIGAINHHSIVSLGDRHFFFNREYGFMEYRGGRSPVPISDNIRPDINNMIWDNTNLIVGCYIPTMRCVVWTVPMVSSTTPNKLLFYHIDTKQWWWLDRSFRYVDYWQAYNTYTWQDFIRDLGGLEKSRGTADTDTANKLVDSGATFSTDGVSVGDEAHNTTDGTFATVSAVDSETSLSLSSDVFPDGDEDYEIGSGAIWTNAGANSWAYFTSLQSYLVYSNTDGHLYNHSGELISGFSLDGYRIEPVLDFGNAKRKDLLLEIWFQLGYYATHSIQVYHRLGDTVAELTEKGWTSLGTLALNTNKPCVYVSQSGRLHQIKWETDSNSEYFEVNKITFKFEPQSEN